MNLENAAITDISFQITSSSNCRCKCNIKIGSSDTITGDSQIISDHKFAAYDPHVNYGILMFLHTKSTLQML